MKMAEVKGFVFESREPANKSRYSQQGSRAVRPELTDERDPGVMKSGARIRARGVKNFNLELYHRLCLHAPR
jgi:hypothetical protein